MKVISTRGDWIGLAYWKGYSYRVDNFSSPDDLNFGFEIVYRLIFYTCDNQVIEKFRTAFKKAFGLSDEHYEMEQLPEVGNSVFWSAYWDREGFELDLLEKCETEFNRVAEAAATRIVVLEMAIIPRSAEYVRKMIELNK